MPYEFGDIVLVAFPFTDQSATKQRPAAIISKRSYNDARADIIIMAITSRLRDGTDFADVRLQEWQPAGLLKPSSIKPIIATLEQKLIRKQLGVLAINDQNALRDVLRTIIG